MTKKKLNIFQHKTYDYEPQCCFHELVPMIFKKKVIEIY